MRVEQDRFWVIDAFKILRVLSSLHIQNNSGSESFMCKEQTMFWVIDTIWTVQVPVSKAREWYTEFEKIHK